VGEGDPSTIRQRSVNARVCSGGRVVNAPSTPRQRPVNAPFFLSSNVLITHNQKDGAEGGRERWAELIATEMQHVNNFLARARTTELPRSVRRVEYLSPDQQEAAEASMGGGGGAPPPPPPRRQITFSQAKERTKGHSKQQSINFEQRSQISSQRITARAAKVKQNKGTLTSCTVSMWSSATPKLNLTSEQHIQL
jgi:hypothetical protein